MAIIALGPFCLDTAHSLLLRGGAPVPLGRRAIVLLRTLIERPGALVSKEVLIKSTWSGRFVEESNLTVQIAALRRVLGEAPGGNRWIETVQGRGYRANRRGSGPRRYGAAAADRDRAAHTDAAS